MEDHEQAWGGFRFSGKIRKDGSILLKRKAVSINLVSRGGGETFDYDAVKFRKRTEMTRLLEHGSLRADYVLERFLLGYVLQA